MALVQVQAVEAGRGHGQDVPGVGTWADNVHHFRNPRGVRADVVAHRVVGHLLHGRIQGGGDGVRARLDRLQVEPLVRQVAQGVVAHEALVACSDAPFGQRVRGVQDAERGARHAVGLGLLQVPLGRHVGEHRIAALHRALRVCVRVQAFDGLEDAHQ